MNSVVDPAGDISDAKFKTLANSAPVLLWMAGPDGLCDFFNDRWLKFTGRALEQEVGNGWAEGIHPEDFQRCMHTYLEAFVDRENFEMEYRLRRADGEYRWIYDLGIPHFDLDGRFAGYIGSCVDITEQRESREVLRRAGDQLRMTIQVAPTGIIMVNEKGTMVMTNSLVQSAFGYTRDELQGQPIEMLMPTRLREGHEALRRTYLDAPIARPMGQDRQLYGRRKDGTEISVEVGLNPLTTSEGRFVLASVVDITARKRAEAEREKLTERLRDVNTELNAALREREALLQEVHHRVKNNLQLISSLINMQVRRLGPNESRDALEQCAARVRTMALIHEKLHISGLYSQVSFSEYARNLAQDVLRATRVNPEAVRLDLRLEEVDLSLEQAIPCGLIINELVSNSLKHAFPDGRSGIVTVSLSREGSRISLTVSDDGVGLEQPDAVGPDTLGLQLVTTFVEQLRGRIEVHATSGTRVSVVFDRKEPVAAPGADESQEKGVGSCRAY